MKRHIFSIVLFCIMGMTSVFGQDELINTLENTYTNYELVSLETDMLYKQLKEKNVTHELLLSIGENNYELELWDSEILGDDYKVTLASGEEYKGARPLTLKGYVKNNPSSKVRLTVNEGFVYGFIYQNGKNLNIQPASYHDDSVDSDLMVAYYDTDLIDKEHKSCGTTNHRKLEEQIINTVDNNVQKSVGDCYEVVISLAADWLMFQEFGSGTDSQIIGVLNDVESSYDDEFADNVLFDLNEVWISDCSNCDPWTSSTDADDLLDDFTDWAPNNLGSHEVATLWTDRNLDGSTIGLAWVGTACTTFGYNICQNINGAQTLRVLQAHELGHNFNSLHDSGSGFIMSPSVSGTTAWSSQSEDDILDYIINATNCFASCSTGGGVDPVADFDYDLLSVCTPGEVEFFDDSEDADSWFWTFEGGTPSTSTDQNPVVFYDFPGTYDVTLEVFNNSGDDELYEPGLIEISDEPIISFDFEVDGLEVNFENNSSGYNLIYVWNFGDGNFSNEEEPAHVYDVPGTYIVELDIENDCGFEIMEQTIVMYDEPDAMFTVDEQSACANDWFQFDDTSYGNVDSRLWSFPGGTPASSSDPSPTVFYATPGTYDVTLEITNPEGQSTLTKPGYISILTAPTAGFTYSASNTVVTFTNTSTSTVSYSWDFGDGQESTDANPVHNYASAGTYSVSLDIQNACGIDNFEQTIVVYDQPNALFSSTNQAGCEADVIQFSDISNGSVASRIWSFPGGSPATSTDPNPLVTYNNAGVYDVTLEVTNPSGTSTLTESSYISITALPTAGFTSSNSNVTVTFTNNSTGATNYIWNFGDGNSSSDASPTHTYGTSGNYNVTLTSSNTCGSVTETQTITTTLNPVAQIGTIESTTGCATHTINFVDTSLGNPTSWSWSFPGGNPSSSNMQNPTVSYNTPGSYDVSLTVGNSVGSDSQMWNDYVQVLGPPTATYTLNVVGNRLDLSNTTPGTTAVWEVSDGSIHNGNNVAHVLEANGSYQVRLEVTDNCGTDVVEFTVEVDAYPTSGFSSVNTLISDCAPQTVQFTSNALLATGYSWQFPGGNPSSSTEENPVVTYVNVGTYDVSLEVSNQYGTDMSTQNGSINVIGLPTADFATSTNGPSVSFTNTSINGTSYSWDFGDGNTSNMENPTHNYTDPGTYEVIFAVTNECGTTETTGLVVFDFALPIINADFSVTTGCAPLEVAISDQTTNNPNSWSWQMPGGNPATSTEQNPVVSYDTPGTYTIMAEIANDDGSSMFEFTDIIVVNDVPTSVFNVSILGETISMTNNSVGATSYSWDFGDGETSTDFEPSHTYDDIGEYDVVLSATNDCGTVEYTQTITIVLSNTIDVQAFGQWTLAPNPTTGEVTISFENKLSESLNYSLKDINGRNIKEGVFNVGTQYETLSISENGLYLLVLTRGDKIDVKKLTVID